MGDPLTQMNHTNSLLGYTRPYDNADFVKSFVQSFMNFIISKNPNTKFDATNPTPTWKNWSSDHTEMLFNQTTAGEPDIRAVSTDPGLLKRCEYVIHTRGHPQMILIFRCAQIGSGIAWRSIWDSKFNSLTLNMICTFRY
jgi:hypothetical protein